MVKSSIKITKAPKKAIKRVDQVQDMSLLLSDSIESAKNEEINTTMTVHMEKSANFSDIPPILNHDPLSKKHKNFVKRMRKKRNKSIKINESTFLQATFDGKTAYEETGDLGDGIYEVEMFQLS